MSILELADIIHRAGSSKSEFWYTIVMVSCSIAKGRCISNKYKDLINMAKKLAVVFGIVFVIVGILGFIPGNGIVGDNAIFVTDAIHNIVHLLIGVILLLVAKNQSASAMWLKIFGVVYLVLFIDGLIQPDKLLGFVTANNADTWLHLVLGIVLLAAGFMAKGSSNAPMMMDKTTM